jgi:radical SAM-linked protein
MSETNGQPRQRWQILFERTAPALWLRQEAIISAWEDAFRRAELPLSEAGARSRARLRLAANLPTGVESRGEVLEAHFDELVPEDRIRAAAELLPDGLRLVDAREVWHGFASAASQVRAAEYEVRVRAGDGRAFGLDELGQAVARLLAASQLPGRRSRGATERLVDAGARDLRPLIEELSVEEVDAAGGEGRLAMTLRLNPAGSGRPQDVIAALDMPLKIVGVVRRRLLFVDTPPIARYPSRSAGRPGPG